VPWIRGCKILALYTHTATQSKNSWVLVTGGSVGSGAVWFKLYNEGDSFSFINMYTTFAAARQANSYVDFEVFGNEHGGIANMIFQVYGW
jgi:hypothetical protein